MSKPEHLGIRAPRLRRDEKLEILTLVAQGFSQAEVARMVAAKIPRVRAYHVRDCARRNPELLREVSGSQALTTARRRIRDEAIRQSIPEILERTRTELVQTLPLMIAREIESLTADQDLLAGIRADVKTPSDAAAFLRAAMLREQRCQLVFGLQGSKPPETSSSIHLHAHITGWRPEPIERKVDGCEVTESR
jgi:hypothetical protein